MDIETMSSSPVDLLQMDANNNSTKKEKSYSLRPRCATKRDSDDDEEETVKPVRPGRKKGSSKRKSRLQPLSKYRRKTANARERTRMREINEAFESLRRAVPVQDEKMTKIMTLRLAINYISALSDVLSEPLGDSSDVESLLSESTQDFSTRSDQSLTPPLPQLGLLDSSFETCFSSDYSDLADPLPLDPYDDFTFALDDTFSSDFS